MLSLAQIWIHLLKIVLNSVGVLMAEDSGGRAKGEEELEMVDFPWDFRFIRIPEWNTFTVMTCDDFVLVVQKQHFNALWKVCSTVMGSIYL